MESKTIVLPKVIPCISINGPAFDWSIRFELVKIWDSVHLDDEYPQPILEDAVIPVNSLVNKISNFDDNPNWRSEHVRLNTTSGQSEIYISVYQDSERYVENTIIDDHLNKLFDLIDVLVKDVKNSNPCINSFLEITGDKETDNLIEASIYDCAAKVLNSIEVIHTDELLQIVPFCGIIERRIFTESRIAHPYVTKETYMKIITTGDNIVLK